MSQAQELIPLFLKTYIPWDVKQQPNSNIEKSKEHMTESFYKKISATQQRYTLDVTRRTVTNIELTPADIRQTVQWWDADIEVQQTDASEKYGVPWNLLAAIHRIETRFSTLKPMISKVGAEGHMQVRP